MRPNTRFGSPSTRAVEPRRRAWYCRTERRLLSAFAPAGLFLVVAGWPARPAEGGPRPVVEVEEVVTTYTNADNGAGPLWCYGSTVIARHGEKVYLSVIETGKDVPPLSNTRWQLWHRSDAGWRLAQHEEQYRQREPCPVAIFDDGRVFLSVNPSTRPPGVKYGPCHPLVLEFDPGDPSAKPVAHEPAWADGTRFTDHSYRGFAADGANGELLLLNINADTGAQFVSLRDRAGKWHAKGKIEFPIRSCYPEVALRGGAAHVLAIGDIVEPVKEWRELKYAQLKRDWDYVFRRLFYAFTPDVRNTPFAPPIEIDTVERTCGHISNLDLYVDESGGAHLLYLKHPHQHAFIRDKYFANQPMTAHLEYVVMKDGKVVSRRALAETPRDGRGLEPAYGRFHVTADGTLCVIAAGTISDAPGKATFGNFVATVPAQPVTPEFVRIDLEHPFHNFMTATPRAGSRASDIIDLFGTAEEATTLRYARIRLASPAATRPADTMRRTP